MAKTELFVRKQAGGMFSIENQAFSTGSRFFVDSATGTDGAGYGQDPDSPVATIDYAVALCTASKGDIIYVMPGHAETVSAAAGIDLDVQGISVIGLGTGTDRPQITFSATASDIDVDAANVTIKNLHFINDVDSLAAAIDVNAAHCTIENCLFDDATAAKNTLIWVITDAAADYLTVRDCTNHGTDTAGNTAWVELTGSDHCRILNCDSHGDFSQANVEVKTTACTDLVVRGCLLENANAVDTCILGVASTTGWFCDNHLKIATNGQTTGVNTPGSAYIGECYCQNNDGETAGVLLTVST